VPPRDPARLARRLLRLQADPALAAALGQAGVRRVRACFTWQQVAAQLAGVYARLAAPLVPPRRAAAP